MSKIYTKIKSCRICGSKSLTDILDLGEQKLTGVFPLPSEAGSLPSSPVTVCKCNHCHLVQLKHTVNLDLMYGDTYGYQSSLNGSMIRHLESIADEIKETYLIDEGDIILDIGSNDGTFLKFFKDEKVNMLGIDPTAKKFSSVYESNGMYMVPEFFSKEAFYKHMPDHRKAKIITSIACFYDLENPIEFAKETAEILEKKGAWIIEAAYLPLILKNLCFDGYVQEHLEYYSLKDIKYIMDQAGLVITDVKFNDVNGGSFRVTVRHDSIASQYWRLESLLLSESHLTFLETHEQFKKDVETFKDRFVKILSDAKRNNATVYGLGASTKFNVILQYCNIGTDLIPAIGEVNSYKFGRVTPGTKIPIVPEAEILARNPDYLVIGPYHFRDSFVKMLKDYMDNGGAVIFPLPNLEIVSR